MTDTIATIRRSKAVSFLLLTAALGLFIVLFGAFVIGDFLVGSGGLRGIIVLLFALVISARFFFGQALVLFRGWSADRKALWIAGDRLIYLSPWYSSLPLRDLGAIDLQVLKRGLGKQPYGVITNGSGKKMHLHLSILNESLEDLRDRFKDLIRA